MTIVLRLQGLNIEAGVEDIRRFFHGLHIPEGSVHIIGGDQGEAFILFTTERDGQLAMRRSGLFLRGSRVTLHVSSVAELKHQIISRLKKQKSSAMANNMVTPVAPAPAADPTTALLLGLVAAIQGLQSNNQVDQSQTPLAINQTAPATYQRPARDQTAAVVSPPVRPVRVRVPEEWGRRESCAPRPGYLRLYGLPDSATKQEICQFFQGLHVQEVVVNVRLGRSRCCLVKFAEEAEAREGLRYSHSSLGSFCVEVREATAELWADSLEQCKNASYQTPPHTSSSAKRCSEDQLWSGSPKRHQFRSLSPGMELCIMVQNLPKVITKTGIKELFSCRNIPNSRVLHLLDEQGERTSTAFIIFNQAEEYVAAINMDGSRVGARGIDVSSVTMEKVLAMTRRKMLTPVTQNRKSAAMTFKRSAATTFNRKLPGQRRPERPQERSCSAQTCVYARNFPADVRKTEIKDFFSKCSISEESITVLQDEEGRSVGEAVVQFSSEELARRAQTLQGRKFMGTRVLITCITPRQMEDILHKTQ